MSDSEALKAMCRALFVRSKKTSYPLSDAIVPHPGGLSVVIFEGQSDIDDYMQDRGADDLHNFEFVRVGSVYDRMREFADLGFVGIWFFNHWPVFLANRVSEYDNELPSIGLCPDGEGHTFCFGASGILPMPRHRTSWRNYFKTDKIIRRNISFPSGYPMDPADTFYTIIRRPNGGADCDGPAATIELSVTFPDGSPLHGPYESPAGAFVLFRQRDEAEAYARKQGGASLNDLRVVDVPNLVDYLEQLYGIHNGFKDVSLDPGSARYLQGYFFRDEGTWYVRTVSGFYEITNQNRLRPATGGEVWPPKGDTVDEDSQIDVVEASLSTVVMSPLKRLLGSTRGNLPQAEAAVVVANEIESSHYASGQGWGKPVLASDVARDSFTVFGFDKISGTQLSNEGVSPSPYVFSDFLEACCFFYHCLFKFDAEIRTDGYTTCEHTKAGTGNSEYENSLLIEKQEGISSLMEDILVRGYSPSFGERVMNYVNRSSPVLEITKCGYWEDLVTYESDLEDDLLEFLRSVPEGSGDSLDIHRKLEKLSRSIRETKRLRLPYEAEQELRRFLGPCFELLTDKSRMVLHTAIKEFRNAGENPTYDYAGISMKLCKVFEIELKRTVFEGWRKEVSPRFTKNVVKSLIPDASGDRTLTCALNWLSKREKVELGSMGYLLERARSTPDHEVLDSLRQYIGALPSSGFILSDNLYEAIKRISSTYRNGGVHEHMVTHAVCRDAFEEILTKPNNVLCRLLAEG